MRNLRLTIEYDGTCYRGWQRQKDVPSVQAVLEDALSQLTGHPVELLVAGRTDAGVHALGQTANFKTSSLMLAPKIQRVLNRLLPPDIRVLDVQEVPDRFHATYHAAAKIYRYRICNSRERSVWVKHFTYHVPQQLDLSAMRRAARFLVGKRDFTSFRGSQAVLRNPLRNLMSVRILKRGGEILFEYRGNSFLYQMIRILTGTLVYVGLGKFSPQDVKKILLARDRRKAGPTLPPQGLFLVKVFYPKVLLPLKKAIQLKSRAILETE